MRLFIGLDIGTTAAKAVIIDEKGKPLGFGTQSYQLITEKPLFVEQNPNDWCRAAEIAIRQATTSLNREDIVAISTSTQGATMLMVDSSFRPMGHALTWLDGRADTEEQELRLKFGDEFFYRLCGWRLEPALDAAKILWLNRNDARFDRTYMFLTTQEHINHYLTGVPAIDPSNASIRQLFNINKGEWSKEVCDFIGIKTEQLPPVVATGEPIGKLTKKAAEALGLSEDVVVFCGAHDQYAACIGGAATQIGDAVLSTGTTWVINAVCDRLHFTKEFISPGIHPQKGLYGAMASIIGAGSAFDWVRKLGNETSFDELRSKTKERLESTKDLYLYPFFSGGGYPHWTPSGAGFFGLTLAHDKFDMALAAMEGAAFETKTVIDTMKASGIGVNKIIMMGGAAQNDFQCRITRAVCGVQTVTTDEKNACALGAAMIAAVGKKAFSDYSDAAKYCVKTESVEVKDENMLWHYSEKYDKYLDGFAAYKKMTEALK